MSHVKKVGFVGLGIMGKPMARNLLKAGFELTVHSRSKPPVDELISSGATAADSPSACAEGTDVVVTMLPDSPDSETVILGDDGVLAGARQGATIIDMSSIAPVVSQKIAAACESKVGDVLDAPVSGGPHGADAGTIAALGDLHSQSHGRDGCM